MKDNLSLETFLGITGVITGRALYEGTLDLAEAIALTRTYQRSSRLPDGVDKLPEDRFLVAIQKRITAEPQVTRGRNFPRAPESHESSSCELSLEHHADARNAIKMPSVSPERISTRSRDVSPPSSTPK